MTGPSKLIFLPGAGGSTDFWKPVSDSLKSAASRCLMGWPGFGANPENPQVRGMDDLASMVVSEIDRPSALIAQSMGGVIAIKAALQKPDLITHLVLVATSGGMHMSDLSAEDWRPGFIKANPSVPSWFVDYREDLSDQFTSVHAPTLLLWGDADPISPLTVGMRLRDRLPHARLRVIANGGHDLAHAHATVVAKMIGRHLATIQVRPVSTGDVPAMARLRDASDWSGGASEVTMRRYVAGEHHPQQALMPRMAFVAESGGEMVGFIAGHRTTRFECHGEVQWLLVAPECRGGTVGSMLLAALAEWFTTEHATRVCVNVAPDNERARRFYERHGAVDLSEYWMEWPDIGRAGRA